MKPLADAIPYKTALELADMLEAGQLSAVELAQALLAQHQKTDTRVKAFLRLDPSYVLQQAEASDQRRRAGKPLSRLDGIPVGLKDNLAETGQALTCASKILEGFVSPYDATVIRRLKAAGAITYGRLNMDEFAMGSSTENSVVQKTCNPWQTDYSPGGSSGGSAAAVASAQVPLALGSDTGGSIRQPASLCGIVGLKPTYGLVSRYGLVAFASSLDQIGPMGRSVSDVAFLLQALAGADPLDSTSYPAQVPDYLLTLQNAKDQDLSGRVIGIPKEYFGYGIEPEVQASIQKAMSFYQSLGCELREVSLPHTDYAIATYYVLASAEASSNLARYDGVRYGHRSSQATDMLELYTRSRGEGLGAEVKRRILLGTYVLSGGYHDAYYTRAQKVRSRIRQDFMEIFASGVDVILTPTSPQAGFKLGEKSADPLTMYLSDIYTVSVNLAGLPGISLPCGFTQQKPHALPIGLQLIGKPYQEASLLAWAQAFERQHPFANLCCPTHPTL
jgi:aspartyl-tRNA(Asn)/glutamyl-tRNA(Gln) amidotransferase subunit A